MFKNIYRWWQNWCASVCFLGLLSGVALMLFAIWYIDTHQKVIIDGVEVQVTGKCWYLENDPKAGGRHQFFASNELIGRDMSMKPSFTLINTGGQERKISIHSLSAWKVPISGSICLEPGQRFEFQINTKWKHWYCWIDPEPPVAKKSV